MFGWSPLKWSGTWNGRQSIANGSQLPEILVLILISLESLLTLIVIISVVPYWHSLISVAICVPLLNIFAWIVGRWTKKSNPPDVFSGWFRVTTTLKGMLGEMSFPDITTYFLQRPKKYWIITFFYFTYVDYLVNCYQIIQGQLRLSKEMTLMFEKDLVIKME